MDSQRTFNASQNTVTWILTHLDLVTPLAVGLALRCILTLFAAFVSNSVLLPSHPTESHLYDAVTLIEPHGLYLFFAPFQRWDGIWYQFIAESGYSATNTTAAFFPLYPILIRALMPIAANATIPAQIISLISTVIAFSVFFRATARLLGKAAANYSLLAWVLFPTAFFLFAPYAESVFVLCSLLSLEAVRERHWWLAGALGGLSALSRSPGILLVLPLGIECIRAHGVHRLLWRPRTIRLWIKYNLKSFVSDSLSIVLVPLAVGSYMLYLNMAFGDAFLWQHALSSWKWTFVLPWETVRATIAAILTGNRSVIANNVTDLVTTLVILTAMVIALILYINRSRFGDAPSTAPMPLTGNTNRVSTASHTATRRIAILPLIYIVYGLVFSIGPLFMMPGPSEIEVPLYAAGRRAVVVFPAFIVIGAWLSRSRLRPFYLAVSFATQLILVSGFALWFWID